VSVGLAERRLSSSAPRRAGLDDLQHDGVVEPREVEYVALRWNPVSSRAPGNAERLMTDEVLTIREVADLLKLAGKTIYSMAQRGEIPAFKVRGQWRIQRTDLTAWIEARKQPGTQPACEREDGPSSKEEEIAGRPSRTRAGTTRGEGKRRSR
jgi:excisionase family DNA binding protein